MNHHHAAQKAALTRAIRSGSLEKVENACRKAVAEWNAAGGYWPDDWSRWQRALDDAWTHAALQDSSLLLSDWGLGTLADD